MPGERSFQKESLFLWNVEIDSLLICLFIDMKNIGIYNIFGYFKTILQEGTPWVRQYRIS